MLSTNLAACTACAMKEICLKPQGFALIKLYCCFHLNCVGSGLSPGDESPTGFIIINHIVACAAIL